VKNLSYTEENYLKAIYHLSPEGEPVSTNALAASMETTPASVNDMIKRLAQKGLLVHQKYHGASISAQGKNIALQVIRKHRLWEVFLVEKLHFGWDEVHEVAEQLEHIHSPLLIQRLDEFLGHPTIDPHGDPIPDANGQFKLNPQTELLLAGEGSRGVVTAVTSDQTALLKHLDKLGIRLGSKLTVKERHEFDGSMQVTVDGKDLYLSREVAQYLMITAP
jgi:DtxR family transcriptional regulator, Mn-dependent transcriptional regulator